MKKHTLFATLFALLLGACTPNELDNIAPEENNAITLPDLTAGFADDDVTKTYVEEGKYLRWHEADLITAFYGNTLNRQYKFNGKTGDNSGTFSLIPSGELGTGNELGAIYAIYPYDAGAIITDKGEISLTLPATQLYAENSFGKDANTMIAVTESVEDTFLGFKNACGYLQLKLYNESGARLKSVEVKGNSGEKIAGSATITIEFGGVPTVVMGNDATTTVTLDCGEDGIALGTTAETATELWVVLPEVAFEGGITITATDTEGGTFEKSTTNPVAITRNDIQPMAVLEAEFVVPTPETWKIYYTATAKIEKQSWSNTMFGVNIVSNEWDETTGEGVIAFDGTVTKIGDRAFSGCSSLASITIPEGVTSIGEQAFWGCTSLTSVSIGNGVTSIGDNAFQNCDSLTSITIPDGVTSIGWGAFACGSSIEKFEGKFASDDARCLIVNGVLNSFAPAGLTAYTIPNSVTSIGGGAFCQALLRSVTIPQGVIEIGNYAFQECSKLTSITIPDSVTSIGGSAFYECSSLTSVTIGNGVTKIGDRAFSDCTSLTSVYCKPTTPPRGGDYMFYIYDASGRKIYVPTESLDEYKVASYWKDYANSIEPYVFE